MLSHRLITTMASADSSAALAAEASLGKNMSFPPVPRGCLAALTLRAAFGWLSPLRSGST
jgi:hypothetical protein